MTLFEDVLDFFTGSRNSQFKLTTKPIDIQEAIDGKKESYKKWTKLISVRFLCFNLLRTLEMLVKKMNIGGIKFISSYNLLTKSGLIKEKYIKLYCSNICDDLGIVFVPNNRLGTFDGKNITLTVLRRTLSWINLFLTVAKTISSAKG